jgi:uroporphyrinogen-III synthase
MRGATVLVDDEPVALPPGELRLLRALVDAGGAVVGKATLARAAGIESDDAHAVEVVVARLRRRLGPAAPIVETIPRRGYRYGTPR